MRSLRGIIFSLISALGYSSVYIIARFAQEYTPIDVFLFWWFFIASLLSFIFVGRTLRGFSKSVRNNLTFFLYFGLSEATGTFIFFYLLKLMNPSLLSFIGNLSPLFVALWAFLLMNEKLGPVEIIGGLIAIAGVIIITGASPKGEIVKILVVVAITLMFAFNTVLVRIKVKDIQPIFMVSFRVYSLFTIYAIYLFIKTGFAFPDIRSVPFIISGALMGPIIATFAVFEALKYLKAADVTIIKSIQPLLVTLGSYVFLHRALTIRQFLGGILILIGVNAVIIAASKERSATV